MKFSKFIVAIFFITTFIFNSFGQTFNKTEVGKIYQLLENSDSRGTFEFLTDLFEKNGASVFIGAKSYPALQLQLKDLTEVINDYSSYENTINVSRMPKFDEAKIYWENWSKVLAKDNFKQDKFFRDDRERFLMANFNSLILMSHEYGHYLDDRYDFNHFSSANPLNCGEYYADKFAIAVINELAQDERFGKLRNRYIELIKKFNESLPSENRFENVNYELLKSDCGSIKMEGNGVNSDGSLNYDFFRRYASAYFNRHQLMLADEKYPKLAEVIENELTKPYEPKKFKLTDEKVSVRTIKEFKTDFVDKDYIHDGSDKTSQTRSALNQKGEIVHARATFSGKNLLWDTVKIEFLDAEQKNVTAETSAKLPKDLQAKTFFHRFLPVNDNLILLFFGTSDDISDCSKSFAKAEKINGTWQVKFSKKDALKNFCETHGEIFVTPSGKIRIINAVRDKAQKGQDEDDLGTTLNEFSLDLEAMKPQKKNVFFRFINKFRLDDSLFGNDQNRVLAVNYSMIFEIKDQTPILLGTRLRGIKDGQDKEKIGFVDIAAIRWIDEKRIVFVDKLDDEKCLLREIILE
jgi:hypothetical protein